VRTFVAVADSGQFLEAAAQLSLTQQAVSKRIAGLEKALSVRLFTRTSRGATLTVDGQAFLPHARAVLTAADNALASVQSGRRPLRVDMITSRVAPALLLRGFHQAHPDARLDVVTLFDIDAATSALRAGTIDATFRAVNAPQRQLVEGLCSERVFDEPIQLLVNPRHPLADRDRVSPIDTGGQRIWIPGLVEGTEWADFYTQFAATFQLNIDAVGPNFGTEHLLDVIADSPSTATLVGTHTRLVWPAQHDLRRIPIIDPTPVYPHSLIWKQNNPHPTLSVLRDHLMAATPRLSPGAAPLWTPSWAEPDSL